MKNISNYGKMKKSLSAPTLKLRELLGMQLTPTNIHYLTKYYYTKK